MPLDLTDEQNDWIRNHPETIRLTQKSKELTRKIRQCGYSSWQDAKGTDIYEEKMKAVSALNYHKSYMRTKPRARAWKMAFPERRHGRIQPAVWRQYCWLQPEEPNDDRRTLGIARTGFFGQQRMVGVGVAEMSW